MEQHHKCFPVIQPPANIILIYSKEKLTIWALIPLCLSQLVHDLKNKKVVSNTACPQVPTAARIKATNHGLASSALLAPILSFNYSGYKFNRLSLTKY